MNWKQNRPRHFIQLFNDRLTEMKKNIFCSKRFFHSSIWFVLFCTSAASAAIGSNWIKWSYNFSSLMLYMIIYGLHMYKNHLSNLVVAVIWGDRLWCGVYGKDMTSVKHGFQLISQRWWFLFLLNHFSSHSSEWFNICVIWKV